MTVSYPITLPTKPGKRTVSLIGSNSSAMTASPWSGTQQVQVNQAQLWRFSLELPPMREVQARAWMGALLSLRGLYGTFFFGDPLWKAPLGSWAGAPVINGAGQTGAVLNLTGFTAGSIGKAGDWLQLGSGTSSRLHMVTQDFIADGSGNAAIDIFPSLRSSPLSGAAVVTQSPQGIFRLASPDVGRTWEPFRFGIAFEVVEAI
jgi:hypothetical protein